LAQRKSEEQLWGDFLHQCLSRVRVPKDVEVAVELNYLPQRHATWMSKDDVKSNLHHLIDQPSTRSWFEGWDEAWIERDIITPRGDVIRPDRVIRRDDTFIIVDYKTGKQEDQHQAQIKRYAEVLADMYPSNRIEAWLWYISNNLIVQVI
jgi:ATP-dependent exoDNAse (exonuclease V) beta subunit